MCQLLGLKHDHSVVPALAEPVKDDRRQGQQQGALSAGGARRAALSVTHARNLTVAARNQRVEETLHLGDVKRHQAGPLPGQQVVKQLRAQHWREVLTAGMRKTFAARRQLKDLEEAGSGRRRLLHRRRRVLKHGGGVTHAMSR